MKMISKNTKRFIIISIAIMILAGCASGEKDKDKENITTVTTTVSDTVTEAVVTEAETIAVIPPVPSKIPDIPDSSVMFTNDYIVVQVNSEGYTYANGKYVESSEANLMIQQAIQNQAQSKDTTTVTVTPAITTTVTAPVVTKPVETLPTGTIFIDDTEDDKDNSDNKDNNGENIEEDIFYLGKYVSSAKTDLAISDIYVLSESKTGVTGLDKFYPGEKLLINILCNPEARFDSTLYIVPEEVAHADSYKNEDCLMKIDMFYSLQMGPDHLLVEVKLPDKIMPGVYEFRFVCGNEEGYVPFHLG